MANNNAKLLRPDTAACTFIFDHVFYGNVPGISKLQKSKSRGIQYCVQIKLQWWSNIRITSTHMGKENKSYSLHSSTKCCPVMLGDAWNLPGMPGTAWDSRVIGYCH